MKPIQLLERPSGPLFSLGAAVAGLYQRSTSLPLIGLNAFQGALTRSSSERKDQERSRG